MRYLGAINERKQAEKEAKILAEKDQKVIVIEKAMCGKPRKTYRCYRIWEEPKMKGPRVMTFQKWKISR